MFVKHTKTLLVLRLQTRHQPYNATCRQNCQTPVKNLAANAARFLTCVCDHFVDSKYSRVNNHTKTINFLMLKKPLESVQ